MKSLLRWTDESYHLGVVEDSSVLSDDPVARKQVEGSSIVVLVDVDPAVRDEIEVSSGCSIVGFDMRGGGGGGVAAAAAAGGGDGSNQFAFRQVSTLDRVLNMPKRVDSLSQDIEELWRRRNADDLLYMLLVLIDSCVQIVPRVSMASSSQGLGLLWCMFSNCRKEVLECVADPNCRAALDCLTGCGLNDQVCSYQCIVSYESPLFEKFSQCVLQRNNCMKNFAEIPELPVVEPMTTFRNAPLTHEKAEEILIGWLGEERHSWKVVTGQNAAYDIFPNQHQIFYRGNSRRSFWYDPVFQAKTFDGSLVWRRRHYRVRRGKKPGTFFFSVLDNGVISNEFWRIADVDDDLSWVRKEKNDIELF